MVVVVERLRVRASVEEAMSTSPTPLTVLRHIHRSFYSILCGCALSCLTLTLSSHLLISIPVFSCLLSSVSDFQLPILISQPRCLEFIYESDILNNLHHFLCCGNINKFFVIKRMESPHCQVLEVGKKTDSD